MFNVGTVFTPDYERYQGVRPINIHLLRMVYVLMVVFVATESWASIVAHDGA
jgi:hypothetical protein